MVLKEVWQRPTYDIYDDKCFQIYNNLNMNDAWLLCVDSPAHETFIISKKKEEKILCMLRMLKNM